MSNWTLFSNHGHVLFCLSRDPQARLRDVAADVGITERAVQKIARDLQDVGMISVTKNGRRNSYRIHQKKSLRHDIEAGCTLKDLIKAVNRTSAKEKLQASEAETTGVENKPPEPSSPTLKPVSKPLTPKSNVSEKDDQPTTRNAGKEKRKKDDTGQKIERQQGTLF